MQQIATDNQQKQQAHGYQAPPQPPAEKRYLSTSASYLQGLPKGREKDDVKLDVTNFHVSIKHGGMLGGWEYSFPTSSIVEVGADTLKHFMSKEKILRISYKNEKSRLAHVTFAGLRAEDCANKIRQAISGR